MIIRGECYPLGYFDGSFCSFSLRLPPISELRGISALRESLSLPNVPSGRKIMVSTLSESAQRSSFDFPHLLWLDSFHISYVSVVISVNYESPIYILPSSLILHLIHFGNQRHKGKGKDSQYKRQEASSRRERTDQKFTRISKVSLGGR